MQPTGTVAVLYRGTDGKHKKPVFAIRIVELADVRE
jgi:hypothetical protein